MHKRKRGRDREITLLEPANKSDHILRTTKVYYKKIKELACKDMSTMLLSVHAVVLG